MSRMPDFEAEAAAAIRAAQMGLNHLLVHPHHHPDTSAEPAAATATIRTSTPGGPVSLLTEAKTILHDGLAKLETLDEEALAAVEAIKGGNPAASSIFITLAGVAHLPDPMGILGSIDALLKAFAPQQGTGAQPSFQPAGPVVAGQA